MLFMDEWMDGQIEEFGIHYLSVSMNLSHFLLLVSSKDILFLVL